MLTLDAVQDGSDCGLKQEKEQHVSSLGGLLVNLQVAQGVHKHIFICAPSKQPSTFVDNSKPRVVSQECFPIVQTEASPGSYPYMQTYATVRPLVADSALRYRHPVLTNGLTHACDQKPARYQVCIAYRDLAHAPPKPIRHQVRIAYCDHALVDENTHKSLKSSSSSRIVTQQVESTTSHTQVHVQAVCVHYQNREQFAQGLGYQRMFEVVYDANAVLRSLCIASMPRRLSCLISRFKKCVWCTTVDCVFRNLSTSLCPPSNGAVTKCTKACTYK